MQLKCPSCGTLHQTQDHPGAFEILCSCGYSLLVPDEAAMATPVEEPFSEVIISSAPLAMEEEDARLLVPLDSAGALGGLSADLPWAENLTPPDKLPPEMPYDPFELSELDSSGELPSQSPNTSAPDLSQQAQSQTSNESPIPIKDAPKPKFQALIDRTVAASMGQWIGRSFTLEWQGMEPPQIQQIQVKVQRLLEARAWLYNEIKKRNLPLDNLMEISSLSHVPELIAMEIYLGVLEHGGQCKIFAESDDNF